MQCAMKCVMDILVKLVTSLGFELAEPTYFVAQIMLQSHVMIS
jgi:hypothetical protein